VVLELLDARLQGLGDGSNIGDDQRQLIEDGSQFIKVEGSMNGVDRRRSIGERAS